MTSIPAYDTFKDMVFAASSLKDYRKTFSDPQNNLMRVRVFAPYSVRPKTRRIGVRPKALGTRPSPYFLDVEGDFVSATRPLTGIRVWGENFTEEQYYSVLRELQDDLSTSARFNQVSLSGCDLDHDEFDPYRIILTNANFQILPRVIKIWGSSLPQP